MQEPTAPRDSDTEKFAARWRGLARSAEEESAMLSSGCVCAEARGRRSTIYKLRFRCAGRQVVRYLGADSGFAEYVRSRLRMFQRPRRCQRELRQRARQARRLLKDTKAGMAPLLESEGYRFHGLAIRRRRTPVQS